MRFLQGSSPFIMPYNSSRSFDRNQKASRIQSGILILNPAQSLVAPNGICLVSKSLPSAFPDLGLPILWFPDNRHLLDRNEIMHNEPELCFISSRKPKKPRIQPPNSRCALVGNRHSDCEPFITPVQAFLQENVLSSRDRLPASGWMKRA